MAAPQPSSRLEMLQARFQQRQLAEKEQKLLQLYDQQQLRAHQVAQRGSAGSNGSNSSAQGNGSNVSHQRTVTRTTTTTHSTSNSQGGGKVRQMFDERRQTSVKGIDKSYPLEPLDNRSRKHQTAAASNFPVNSPSQLKNGNPTSNRRSVVTRRSVRSEANSNVNDGKPTVTYHEEVTREIDDSADRDNEQEEFGDENFQTTRYDNGNRRIDRPSQLDIEDVTNENTTHRHRTTAKINLTEFDRFNVTNRSLSDNLESEQFLDDEIIDATDHLPERSSAGNKAFPTDSRLERPKHSIGKKIGQTIKQVAGNTTSFTKKRNETAAHSRSSSRATTVTTRLEEEISRGSSTSPEFGGSVKSRNSSPEVHDNRRRSTPTAGSPANKSSGVTKVSQICHEKSSVYYPRRKSEFEKSKTFRRLQLELGESSPEPNEPDEVSTISCEKQCGRRSSVHNENVYSSERRSSSSSPIPADSRVHAKGRNVTRDDLSERPVSRGGSRSPTYREESIENCERRKPSVSSPKKSTIDSSTYSSRRRFSSTSPIVYYDNSEQRAGSNERSESRAEIRTPIYREDAIVKIVERRRTSEKSEIGTHCSPGRRSSSSSPMADYDRNFAREKSPRRSQSREGSDSRAHRRGSTMKNGRCETPSARKKSSNFDSNTYSSRRPANSWNTKQDQPKEFKSRTSESVNEERKTTGRKIGKNEDGSARNPGPTVDEDFSPRRKTSHEKSPERPGSRDDFQRPIYRRESIVQGEETATSLSGVVDVSRYEASTFSSRLHSSSPTTMCENYESTEGGRITSHEVSHEGLESRGRSHSPVDREQSFVMSNETKETKSRAVKVTSNPERDTFSSRQHSSTPITIGRKTSGEIFTEYPGTRKRSQSPIHGEESAMKFDDRKTSGGHTSNYASSTYSSRQHSSSPISAEDRDFVEKQMTSHDVSHGGPGSCDRSQSPTYRNVDVKASSFETGNYSSRRHSSCPSDDYELPRDRRTSREQSPDHWRSRRGSQSPIHQKESIVRDEDERTTYDDVKRSNFASSTFSSRRHSSSSGPSGDFPKERETGHDRADVVTEKRRKSGEKLRSYELIQQLVRSGGPGKKPAPTAGGRSPEGKITLEDIETSLESSDLREPTKVAKPATKHRIVKKDKAPTRLSSSQEKSAKPRERTITRDARSKTVSPSSFKATGETTPIGSKRDERVRAGDAEDIESENRQEFEEITSMGDKERSIIDFANGPDNDGRVSRRSSSEIVVKRHDTFRIEKPSRAPSKIDNISDHEESSFGKKTRDEFKEKSQLLERIEKIRSTLSRGDRSDHNSRSKEFERTDSVESALKRFDSIGVETEHHVTVGIDETDVKVPETISETPYLSSNEDRIPVNEEIVVKRTIAPLCKPAKTPGSKDTQAKAKDTESAISSRKKLATLDTREKHARSITTAKTRKDQTILGNATPRHSDNKMVAKSREGQKRVTSMVKRSKLRNEESSGRGEERRIDDSPICKRKLFDNSESEMENEDSTSTIVLTTTTRVANISPDIVEYEAKNHCENVINAMESVSCTATSSLVETKMESEPTKILRSIEDIRKSIKRESEDLERQLKRFNATVGVDGENESAENPNDATTAGTLSRVQITKTFKSGDRVPLVKIEKTIVKLPIARRLTKSPSPDIGVKRTTEAGRTTKTATSAVRRSVPSSPAKPPDTPNKSGSSEARVPGPKSSALRTSSSLGTREARSQKEFSATMEYSDTIDGPANHCEITAVEITSSMTTKKSKDDFAFDSNDDDVLECREDNMNHQESSIAKPSYERSLTSPQKQHQGPSASPASVSRPASALSTTSSVTSAGRGRSSQTSSSRSKMSTRTRSPMSNGPRGSANSTRNSTAPTTDENDGLVGCKICGRRFNSDRITRHEQICSKTATKKRKQFDATIHRVKGTELEPFVKKTGPKKTQADRKAQKPEVKSNWRRKHEDFINAIRSAKQVQAHLAAGGKLSDLPPPPPSDTSDYIQCPHCGRKFNQAAADRHIPKCQSMMHNKPNPRAPPKPKR